MIKKEDFRDTLPIIANIKEIKSFDTKIKEKYEIVRAMHQGIFRKWHFPKVVRHRNLSVFMFFSKALKTRLLGSNSIYNFIHKAVH